MNRRLSVVASLLLALWMEPGWAQENYRQVPGIIHVQTAFDGAGQYSLDQLVVMAREKGLEVLIPADHDLQAMEYGLFPLRNLIKRREERASVIKNGPDRFLAAVDRANRRQGDVLIIPGVQSSPFYYWAGSPWDRGLTAHGYRKELLLVGLQSAADYRNLPLLHRGFSTRYTKSLLPRSILFLAALLTSIYLARQTGPPRIAGICLGVVSLALLIDHHPFPSSRFDPYHGDQGIRPYQELIDYVRQRGGLVFWLHPESNYAVDGVRLGPVILKTPHYQQDLIRATGYTGFEALYGDRITMTDPAKEWDRILDDFCTGRRERPVWGIAGADFRGTRNDDPIDTFQTVFLVTAKSTEEILNALAEGRFYAVRKGRGPRLVLDRFDVRSRAGHPPALSGQCLAPMGDPIVRMKISAQDGSRCDVHVRLIRGGAVVLDRRGQTPLELDFTDRSPWRGRTFYRLEADGGPMGRLLANPIFVERQ